MWNIFIDKKSLKNCFLIVFLFIFTVWSQPGIAVPPPDLSDIQDYNYNDYDDSVNGSNV